MPPASKPRSNQHLRTRKDLLLAAARLLKEGRKPTMDDVAAAALVSRATAYRYFPSLESLLVEAPLDGAAPDPDTFFGPDASADPEERLDRAEAAMHQMTYQNEAQLRLMLANSLVRGSAGEGGAVPPRQNRRTPLIEAALAPARRRFSKEAYDNLRAALALVFGTEAMVVFRDVVPLSERRARGIKSWAVRALVRAALKDSKSGA
ncbi:MAG TPA: TetR/AcrR family transcriptional regulator [Burkholderiales bacterium]|jgi:AcrR family transcriptional regulator